MKNKNKISNTFFIFLIAAAFIWLLISFSKEYSTNISYTLSYENIPQNKLLQETPLKEISLRVRGTGFNILSANLNDSEINLDASNLLRGKNSQYYFLIKNELNTIQNQISSGIEILSSETDTIYLNLGALASKKIALKPNLDIEYHIGYGLIDNIEIIPDSILVSGPEKQINSINVIDLEQLILKDVKENFTNEVSIKKSIELKDLKLQFEKVKIAGKIDKFTEGTLDIPFSIINVPDNLKLTTLNESIQIKFVTALSNFNRVTESFFKIECDYLTTKDNKLNYLIPKLVNKPNFIKSYKIIPNKIDFLIRK